MLGALQAHAQQQNDEGALAQQEQPIRAIEEIVVTGRLSLGSEVTQFSSSASITTFDEEGLRESGPLTLADVYSEVPGVWAESSGGQSASNVFVRGIPAPGQFLFTKINVDGLPVFEEHGIGFLTPDGLYRLDENTRRVEAVRGGSSAVFASNAPGGIFNHITKKGTEEFEGIIKGEYGDFNHFRADAFISGPIAEGTTYTLGGFYRASDGVRDPGFRGDEGGHIRGSITQQLNKGEVTFYADYINDRNLFLLPIPLGLDEDGDLTSIPGLDANEDTLVSDDQRLATLLQPGGNRETFDLTDGIHNEAITVGSDFQYDLGAWKLANKTRFMDGETNFISAIPFSISEAASFIDGQLARAQAAFEGTERLALRFQGDGVGANSTFDFAQNGAGGNNGNGLLALSGFFGVKSDFDNFQNDLQVGRSVDFLGEHFLTFGFYASLYNIDQTQQVATFLQEVDGSPRNLDLFAVNGAGDVIGAVTQNSFIQFGNGFENYSGDGEVFAIYAADEWQATQRLRIDLGFRFESQVLEGQVETPGVFDESENNPLIPANGLETLADDNILFGTGAFSSFREKYEEFSYSIGANYEIDDWIATYARVSDGFRTPTLDDLAVAELGEGGTEDLLVNDIFQVEGGFKIDLPYLQAFFTAFFSDFSDQVFTEPVLDNQGNLINTTIVQSAETKGIEAEALVGPFYGFSLKLKGTFQDADLTAFDVNSTGAGIDLTDTSFAGLDGNRVPRIPRVMVSVRPKYAFSFDQADGSLFLDVNHTGKRFQDFSNNIILPSFTTVGAGMTLNFLKNFEFTLIADNLTNSIGLTEGNPRTDLLAGPAADSSIATFGRPIVGRNFRFSLAYRF
ncbi:TonB-dependent receptor [Iodidimonas nitroreducens]|uniref:TonB-dependent receptor n=2 Tax=Iodidimonas nitroreducens TaxID=1236968 RepID=A0A5A7N7L1_9PROT|nr:TonB-dependent receptor [Iodidimonas nitroreducens]